MKNLLLFFLVLTGSNAHIFHAADAPSNSFSITKTTSSKCADIIRAVLDNPRSRAADLDSAIRKARSELSETDYIILTCHTGTYRIKRESINKLQDN